jgi:CheY-like chemotaxis protein
MDIPLLSAVHPMRRLVVSAVQETPNRRNTVFRETFSFGIPTVRRRLSSALRCHSGIRPEPPACRNVLLVEHRDKVRQQLAGDLTSAGLQVSHATHAAEAMQVLVQRAVDLLVANFALPDSSGWLLTAKARLLSPTPRVCLYAPWPTRHEMAMAQFVGADGLIAYRGDICRLSAVILSRLTVRPALRLGA